MILGDKVILLFLFIYANIRYIYLKIGVGLRRICGEDAADGLKKVLGSITGIQDHEW